ncbi:ABC transporter ATP-binding protein [Croceicoccus naphthovorans]|uniref:Multidrug ABC transporter ATP-binding protein n=1 Tax=Croceicoccus naphthovorans TaxID=1348774 RepID=A0A0G3XGL2_9SPHN|nr:ABC transporter ATP-binding protein [Croceicoccus naphthovorans]AKM09771.1 multidrug ABC transporter ATP-binding protein [Croceicoccus naphthovorans]MBB3990683.1 ABC-2 type transport system ATP-binding protein [Croceicoccus naphthovorans]
MADPILTITSLDKTYAGRGAAPPVKALNEVNLEIRRGEIFALLGPNGAGKTTLIGAVCGLVRPTGGTIKAFGMDLKRDWRKIRARIGLVPQEMAADIFETVLHSVTYSRGLFGRPADAARVEEVLRSLSLWDKRNSQIRMLSGGMKRRVLIAKALAHDPELLFLDEPTAGVDVELRRDMWRQIDKLREQGVTIILTTHYIEEAEEMADRVGVINKGQILLVDDKDAMMKRLGRTEAEFTLTQPLSVIPASVAREGLSLANDGKALCFRGGDGSGRGKEAVADIAQALAREGIAYHAIDMRESTLEDIFVDLVENRPEVAA